MSVSRFIVVEWCIALAYLKSETYHMNGKGIQHALV